MRLASVPPIAVPAHEMQIHEGVVRIMLVGEAAAFPIPAHVARDGRRAIRFAKSAAHAPDAELAEHLRLLSPEQVEEGTFVEIDIVGAPERILPAPRAAECVHDVIAVAHQAEVPGNSVCM